MQVCMTDKSKYLYADIPWYPIPCKDYAIEGNIVFELGSSWYQKIRQEGVMSWEHFTH